MDAIKKDAKWFFNFFKSKDNWCSGALIRDGSYCAVGHLNALMGRPNQYSHMSYELPIVKECEDILGRSLAYFNDACDAHGEYMDPKTNVLKALREVIKKQDPDCQLGKEYDNV